MTYKTVILSPVSLADVRLHWGEAWLALTLCHRKIVRAIEIWEKEVACEIVTRNVDSDQEDCETLAARIK